VSTSFLVATDAPVFEPKKYREKILKKNSPRILRCPTRCVNLANLGWWQNISHKCSCAYHTRLLVKKAAEREACSICD
jgi:hypothetical protein